ncbi:MAG TPA: TonB-dependent receptor plug domain-containing protein, partial [Puia sp.]|nr:TonB-dependent receptor plug domain-containing protein [Puia sp.]
MGSIKPVFWVLLLACLQRSIPIYCQTHPSSYSLTENGASLEQVLTDIRDKWGYTFFGQGDWPKLAHPLTFSAKNVSLQQLLDICFKDQPLHYTFKDDAIIISIKPTNDGWVHGYVLNEKKEPVPGSTVSIRGGGPTDATATNENGEFRIHVHYSDTWLVISNVNFKSVELPVEPGKDITVELEENIAELVNVAVMGYRTGYQVVKASTATGSFVKVDSALISRRVSPNILDRIDGVTSSVIFNKNTLAGANPSAITIRGRSTIFANPEPLIVVDNFPYTGDVNNINPDDVESITVLKDAAAASIWGAFSGNGVIVITTKKGRYGQAPQISFNTSLTVGNKPNLYYTPILSSSDYIDVEKYLFHQGNYSLLIDGPAHPALTPVVELLLVDSLGQLSDANAQLRINALRGVDTRRDLDKYFYQPSFNQQYSLHLTGGGQRNQYYLSGGYDRDMSNLVRNEYNRITLNGNNTYCLVPGKLDLNTGLAFTSSTTYNNNPGQSNAIYPYQQLADGHGNSLPVNFDLLESYVDTAGGGRLLDWHYRPLDELHNADNTTRLTDYRINIGLQYSIIKGLHANVYYQYGRGNTDLQNYQSQLTYYTRNLINEYTQVGMNGLLSHPVPMGGIFDETVTSYMANYVRGQLNYDNASFFHGVLNLIGGAEVRDVEGDIRATRLYGYNKDQTSSSPVDYTTIFPEYNSGTGVQIPYFDQNTGTSDRFVSYYLNGNYTYRRRYTISASGRRDESNLFGVNANQKGVPLW